MKLKINIILSPLLVLLTFLCVTSCTTIKQESPQLRIRVEVPHKPKPWLGIYTEPINDAGPYGGPVGVKGIRVPLVIPDSPAQKAGLKPNDIILSYDGITFTDIAQDKIRMVFKDYLTDNKKIGEPLTLEIFRTETTIQARANNEVLPTPEFGLDLVSKLIEEQKPGEVLDLHLEKHKKELTLTAILAKEKARRETAPPTNAMLLPELESYSDDFSQLTRALIKDLQFSEYYDELMLKYDDDEWWDDGLRLNRFRYLHRDPFKLTKISQDITDELEELVNPDQQDWPGLIKAIAKILDEDGQLKDSLTKPKDLPLTSEAYLDHIVTVIQKAQKLREGALRKLSKKDIDLLYQYLPDLIGRFVDSYYLLMDAPSADATNYYKILDLAHKIDFSKMLQSATLLASLTESEFLTNLKEVLTDYQSLEAFEQAKTGIKGDLRAVIKTKIGDIAIGGPGWTRYNRDYVLVIDLGGDDFYHNNAGGARTKKTPVAVLIDLAGDDTYAATKTCAQGAGFLGTGLLVDLSGNDNYHSTRLAQGVGLMGVGMLFDLAGNDTYRGQEFNQGSVCWGAGILVDMAGNDRYESHLYAQGVGGPKGCGLLFDISGNDQYFASGKHKSSYGTSGIFHGSSQGFGIGFRGLASGGIGILLDSQGKDLYTAGNFSQGGGYFFGLGILKNSGNEDDTYIASRYGQGFSAHSAAGILIDDGGNDTYQGHMIALQAAAWDLGCAILIDKAGDDTYQATGFSQAASAHNGFALLLDYAGKDSYLYANGPAKAGKNDYHGGYSFSCFIDNGGDEDIYTAPNIGNNLIRSWPEYGIFIDLDRSVTDTLKEASYKKLFTTQ